MASASPRPSLVLYTCAIIALCVAALSFAPTSAVTVAEVGAATIISPHALFVLRCAMLAVNVIATLDKVRRTESKEVVHQAASKLPKRVHVQLRGAVWLTFFTVQSWLLQCVYLLGACVCSASTVGVLPPLAHRWLPSVLWMIYEVSFAMAVLVSAIVKYVIIPTTLANGVRVDNFFTLCDQLMHNCNVLFMALELLFNALPFEIRHAPLAALWGLYYVYFSWGWMRAAGVCWYDFLDPTLPNACVVHTVLVAVLSLFFTIGAGLAYAANTIPAVLRIVLVLAGVASVARTGWLTGVPVPTKSK